MSRLFKSRARVRYAETDASGIVYYANYFIYFEVGRTAMFRELGLPYDRRLPIVDTYCRYHASARFQDELEIHSSVEEIRRRGFRIGHSVYRVNDDGSPPTLLARGYTVMATAGEEGRPISIPPAFREALERSE